MRDDVGEGSCKEAGDPDGVVDEAALAVPSLPASLERGHIGQKRSEDS